MNAMNVRRTKVSNCSKGAVFAMVDKDPTGNYVRHNYLVMSNITEYTEVVLCFGITTARKGRWDNMLPLSSSNDVDSYIDLNKVYEYKVHEFANGHYHGCINDANIMKILTQAMRLRVGLINQNKIEDIKHTLDTVTVSLQDGVIIENEVNKPCVQVNESENDDVDNTPTIHLNTTEKTEKHDEKRETLTGIFPFRTSSWSDEQLTIYVNEYESGKYNACRNHITSSNEKVLMKRFENACIELEKRGLRVKTTKIAEKKDDAETRKVKNAESKPEKQEEKPKSFSQKAKRYSPSFWSEEELKLFAELYETEEGKSILKSEFGLTNAGLISKSTEVHRRLIKK